MVNNEKREKSLEKKNKNLEEPHNLKDQRWPSTTAAVKLQERNQKECYREYEKYRKLEV